MKKILVGILCLVILTSAIGLVMALDPQIETTSATVLVNSFLSVSLTDIPVAFPNMDPGTTQAANIGGGYPLTVTIGAETNVDNVEVETRANAASFTGPGSLTIDKMKWSDNIITPIWNDYIETNDQVCASLGAEDICSIYHQLTIPSGTTAGTYTVGITITATTTTP